MGWFDENHWAGEEAMSRMCGGYYSEHRDIDGKYFAGTRKCSQCKKLKTKKDFNKEQEKKTAAKRICNECGPPLPKDVSILTKAEIMTELRKRGIEDLPLPNAKKAEVLACLQNVLAAEAPSAPAAANDQENQKPLPKYWSQWKVVELKEELKRRGLKVSGTKGVLTARLSENTGIPAESPSKSKLNAFASAFVPGSAPVATPLVDLTNDEQVNCLVDEASVVDTVSNEDTSTTSSKEPMLRITNVQEVSVAQIHDTWLLSKELFVDSTNAQEAATSVPQAPVHDIVRNEDTATTLSKEPILLITNGGEVKFPLLVQAPALDTVSNEDMVMKLSKEPVVKASVAPDEFAPTLPEIDVVRVGPVVNKTSQICQGQNCKHAPLQKCPFGCCGNCCPGNACKVKSHRRNIGRKEVRKASAVSISTISTVLHDESMKEESQVVELTKLPIAVEPSTVLSTTSTAKNLSATPIVLQAAPCQGRGGVCSKKPSARCMYGCCAPCCRANFGMGRCNALSHRSMVKKPVSTATRKRQRLV